MKLFLDEKNKTEKKNSGQCAIEHKIQFKKKEKNQHKERCWVPALQRCDDCVVIEFE